MGDQVRFDFAVPDELLAEVVARSGTSDRVADLAVMPGTGEGRPPPLIGILRQYGYAPLVLLTAAAVVPDTFGNGISIIGSNLETSFHIHDAALGAMVFVASVAQLLWAVPLALWADRGSRKVVAGVALLAFSVVAPLMALAPNVWAFTFLYLLASVGFYVSETVHNSYLSDAYPTEARGRIFSWHNLSDPISLTSASCSSDWWSPSVTAGGGACSSPWPGSPSPCPCSRCTSRTRGRTSRATS